MSYELSFSPEFFLAEGEPYDGGPEHGDKPCSVWGAILLALDSPETKQAVLEAMADDDGAHVEPEAVLERIQEVNTCSNLRSPVEVWVDRDGWCRLLVW